MNNNLLPVGSIVLLKEATRKVVIIGYGVIEEGSNDIWDYLGAAYPIGVISSDKNLIFNRDMIDKVIFNGYVDSEGDLLRKEIVEKIEELR